MTDEKKEIEKPLSHDKKLEKYCDRLEVLRKEMNEVLTEGQALLGETKAIFESPSGIFPSFRRDACSLSEVVSNLELLCCALRHGDRLLKLAVP